MTTVAIDTPDVELGTLIAGLAPVDALSPVSVVGPDAAATADELIVLGSARGIEIDGSTRGGVDAPGAVGLLAATGADTVVVVSSAMVYGAWPDNPVPLTEDAPLRPRSESGFAMAMCEIERAVADLRARRPGATVAVLRPTICVSPHLDNRWLERSLWHARSLRTDGPDRPAQFLHLDDLARAVDFARRHHLDGAFNVAPAGWLSARQQLELVGSGRPPRVPGALSRAVVAARWRAGRTSTPPEVVPYTEHSWVVSSDRLRAEGWRPRVSNEEAFVMGHRPGWWSTLTAGQRQAVSLGGSAAAVALVGAVVVGVARAASRRRG